MSVTGVLLTYESQLVSAASLGNNLAVVPATAPLGLQQLVDNAGIAAGRNGSVVVSANPSAPVSISLGREGATLLNPYTGAIIADQAAGTRSFLNLVERWHRNLNSPGRDSAGSFLIRASNLVFMFLVVSGIYVWLPVVNRWVQFRGRMLFQGKYVNSKARDYNWHHVFSFWALIPLFVIVLSGVVMSYQWANKALFAAFGEQLRIGAPGGAPGGGPGGSPPAVAGGQIAAAPATPQASLDALVASAKTQLRDWNTISVPLTRNAATVSVTAVLNSESPRPPRQQLVLNTADASVIRLDAVQGAGAASTASRGQRARLWMRFAHTGQEYGIAGQTVAGLASLAACFLAYTGLALAYRRLIVPLYRREQ
jgi:uncharacterized iron-regulated membrane protein